MAKKVANAVLDAALAYIRDRSTHMFLSQGEPADFTESNTNLGTGAGKRLAEIAVDSTDFTVGAGDVDGRKLTMSAQSGFNAAVSGSGDHIGLKNNTNSELLIVTTAPSQAITAGNPVTFSAWSYTIRAAT
jgi:hypothetical protein